MSFDGDKPRQLRRECELDQIRLFGQSQVYFLFLQLSGESRSCHHCSISRCLQLSHSPSDGQLTLSMAAMAPTMGEANGSRGVYLGWAGIPELLSDQPRAIRSSSCFPLQVSIWSCGTHRCCRANSLGMDFDQ